MIIPWTALDKYMHSIEFPAKVLEENGPRVALIVSRVDLQALIIVEAVVGIGTWKRIKHLRLVRPIEQLAELKMRLLERPRAALKTTYEDKLCDIYSTITLKRSVHHVVKIPVRDESGSPVLDQNNEPITKIERWQTYEKWDPRLTFKEVKRGLIRSKTPELDEVFA